MVGDDDIGGLDKGELQVLVGFFGKVAVVDLSTGTGYLGGSAAIGGKGIRMGEAGDISDLAIDNDREDVPDAREGLEQLDSRGFLNALADTLLESGDFFLDEIEEDELLLGTTLGF
jgi:hypothetical protein